MVQSTELSRIGAARSAFEDRGEGFTRRVARAAEDFGLSAADVALAAEIADLETGLDPAAWRALFLTVVAARVFLEQGSTRVPVTPESGGAALETVIETLLAHAGGEDAPDRVLGTLRDLLAEGRAPAVIGGPTDHRPIVYEAPYIHVERTFVHEGRLVSRLREALARGRVADEAAVAEALEAARAAAPFRLSEDQTQAVRAALTWPLTVISGGPGTGKTSIVLAMIRGCFALGIAADAIALAAPTGKAAYRLEESLASGVASDSGDADADPLRRVESHTLHRLLGYLPGVDRFRHHRNNRLAERVVIVDEASMIDVYLMERLLSSVRDDGRLVLLGDAEQLPSVEAGAVYRDLVAASDSGGPLAERAVRLTQGFRMDAADPAGRQVLEAARCINAGDAGGLLENDGVIRRDRAGAITFAGVEAWFAGAEDGLEPFLDRWYAERIASKAGFTDLVKRDYRLESNGALAAPDAEAARTLLAHHERSRLLCLTRRFGTGTERINAMLRRRHLDHLGRSPTADVTAGDPVMVLRNDYAHGLYNGDRGTIVWGRTDAGRRLLLAVFLRGDALIALPWVALKAHLDHAYAQTVHKAQGSEFDAVGVILPERDLPLLTRELLYTAVTRARTSVVLVGEEALLRTGIARRIERFSGVEEGLRGVGDARSRSGSDAPTSRRSTKGDSP
jgi:exodeoxyribonuclease V alpha subunit